MILPQVDCFLVEFLVRCLNSSQNLSLEFPLIPSVHLMLMSFSGFKKEVTQFVELVLEFGQSLDCFHALSMLVGGGVKY
jgi:hypothetical protein